MSLACSRGAEGPRSGAGAESSAPDSTPLSPQPACPAKPRRVETSPGVEARHRELEFWLGKLAEGEADTPLFSTQSVRDLNGRAREIDGAWRDVIEPDLGDADRIRSQLDERVEWMRGQVLSGKYVESVPGDFARAVARTRAASSMAELRVVAAESDLRCMPLDASLYKEPADPDFDRNNCASLHAGEWVRVLAHLDEGEVRWDYVHAGHSVGWLRDAMWTPPIAVERARSLRAGARWTVTRDDATTRAGLSFRMGTVLPAQGREQVLVPTVEGLVPDRFEGEVALRTEGPGAVWTRRGLWGAALSELDSPYGWGGRAGERDCSRLLRDVFMLAGLELARHSAVQAKLGSSVIDVSLLDEAAKRQRIDEAAEQGLVLLYMSGHIMLYLGRDAEHQYGVSSISEFLTPCEGGEDTVNRIDRVAVTTLELGRGTKKRAFIERISTIVVLGDEASARG